MSFVRFFPIATLLLCELHTPVLAQEEIRFNKGEVTGTVRGDVTTTIKTWQFRAQKGQRIAVTLTPVGGDKGTLTMTLYAYCGEEYGKPLVSESLQWEGQLPCNDRYTIDVAPSTGAIKPGRIQRYSLTVTII